ncbi:MAG: zinc ribbon domain-containing protein [Gammaproteobacteria bacterium]
MPIYEYQCSACGFQKEMLQKISDEPLKTCPECGKDSMKKMVTAAAFRLKGGGWYETDFKKDKQKNVADAGKADKSTAKSPADKKPAGTGSSTTTKKADKS